MKAQRWLAARRRFEELIELDPDARDRELDQAVWEDPELETLVRSLLVAHLASDNALEPPTAPELGLVGSLLSADAPPEAAPPQRIGAYELLRPLGSGGMGTVYEAIQEEPRRKVALKLMHASVGDAFAQRRFRLEAQVLAHLAHPAISKIVEAGTLEDPQSGGQRPWFAMELVEQGRTLVAFAEHHELSLDDRITLFMQVCEGVIHGHQKGVIHRDLKATNVLVDPSGAPKIIDFGIARFTGSELEQTSRLTLSGEIVGTLGAMSPEQLAGSTDDVDTRTDVYSLGALLFELVTGKPSIDLTDTPLPRAIQRVREERQRRPSEVCDGLPPELDWIVLRAMVREKEGRYPTVTELRADLARLLASEPVLAGPPTAAYWFSKFVRRHRWSVAGSLLLAATLLGAVAWIVSASMQAARDRDKAVTASMEAASERDKAVAINDFLVQTLSSANPALDGPQVRVVDVLDQAFDMSATLFASQPAVRAALLDSVGRIYTSLGQYDLAREHLEESVSLYREVDGSDSPDAYVALCNLGFALLDDERSPELAVDVLRRAHDGLVATMGKESVQTLQAQNSLGLALSLLVPDDGDDEVSDQTSAGGFYAEAERLMRDSCETYRRVHAPEDHTAILFTGKLARFLHMQGQLDEAEEHYRWAVPRLDRLLGPDHPDALHMRNNHAGLLVASGRSDEAVTLMEEAHAHGLERFGPKHPGTLRLANGLGQSLLGAGQLERAGEVFVPTLITLLDDFGELHPLTLDARLGLGTCLYYLGELEASGEQLSLAVEGLAITFGELDERTISTRNNLAMMLQKRGEIGEAERLLRLNLSARRRAHGDRHLDTLGSINNLGFLLMQDGRGELALPFLEEALSGRREVLGEAHPSTMNTTINLADLHQRAGRPALAVPLWQEVVEHGAAAYGEEASQLAYGRRRLGEALAETEAETGAGP